MSVRATGGITHFLSNALVKNCVFSLNTAASDGGGMCNTGSDPVIKDCSFIENKAKIAGGIYSGSSEPVMQNCLFSGNTATGYAGAIYFTSPYHPVFNDCVF
ncbi:MAG: right-handed parallel beta-helix repeat-containing protein [Planctomycetota bacterium]